MSNPNRLPQRRQLPHRPDLQQLKKRAKELLKAHRAKDPDAARRIRTADPRIATLSLVQVLQAPFALHDAQSIVARELDFKSWAAMKRHVDYVSQTAEQRLSAFVTAACSDDLERARELLAHDPPLARTDLYTACLTGEARIVETLLRRDSDLATRNGGPKDWSPLSYICFSRFLRDDPDRAAGMMQIAQTLLDHGADPNSFFRINDDPNAKQTALYGAAGIANHPGLTRVLLNAGADPNDDAPGFGPESLYHASEFEDLECLRLLLEAHPHPDKVSYCFARKLDFEDIAGARLYLEHGADPNFRTPFGHGGTRLHHAVLRRRSPEIVALLLEHGADVAIRDERGRTPYALAVRLGQTESAEQMTRFGARETSLNPTDRLLGACSRGDATLAQAILAEQPDLVRTLSQEDANVLPEGAAAGETSAVRVMLDVGIDIAVAGSDGMTALHWAAWYGHQSTVELLLKRNAPLEIKNKYGGTVLDSTVFGSTHGERHPNHVAIIQRLIEAGADVEVLRFPCGNPAIDELLRPHLAKKIASGVAQARTQVALVDQSYRDLFEGDDGPLPMLEVLDRQARSLLDAHRRGDPTATVQIRNHSPRFIGSSPSAALAADLSLEDTRLVLAREHGFKDWSDVESAADRTVDPKFEAAVDSIALGDIETLRFLLRGDPGLARIRSAYGHQATLLHYVAANGVEIRRQRTPQNAVDIAKTLLEAGAEVDALAETYGGGLNQTTLGLLVTSAHPAEAGVQAALVDVLLDAGAAIDNIIFAASLGRLDAVDDFFDADDRLGSNAGGRSKATANLKPNELLGKALIVANTDEHLDIVERLLDRGAEIATPGPQGFTALHHAAFHGHLALLELLLRRRAPLEVKNEYGGTVLDGTVYAAVHAKARDVDYLPILERLIAAGASVHAVDPFPTGDEAINELLSRSGREPTG